MAESVRQLNLLGDPLDLDGLEPLLERAHARVLGQGHQRIELLPCGAGRQRASSMTSAG